MDVINDVCAFIGGDRRSLWCGRYINRPYQESFVQGNKEAVWQVKLICHVESLSFTIPGFSFNWKAEKTGEYIACFSNEFSTFSHKLVYIDFQVLIICPKKGIKA